MKNNLKIISIVNQKGGVGKTTTAINLGTALAAIDKKILLIDLDPQGNLSTGIGVTEKQRNISVYDLITQSYSISKTIQETKIPNLKIIPSNINLSGIEFELAADEDRTNKLNKKINELKEGYDFVLIDCPPSLGILTVNSLVASDSVLVPLQCEFYALEGLAQLLRTIEKIKDNLNPDLFLEGVILTMFDSRNRLSDDVVADAREHLGKKVFETIIPRNVRLSEAPSHGLPAIIYDQKCIGSLAYIDLAKELINRLGI
ncbi:MAG: chromosome partitioning protein ParA [Pelagibacterales bacterium]|nr:chromosome partitioning protein ParA [Pelagibacterales bacterium]|tara:strand:- start:172 stop:948 length:777 start_codon:yes stop_codon:yes gene_type:complete